MPCLLPATNPLRRRHWSRAAHPLGRTLATALGGLGDAALVPTRASHAGVVRIGPAWCWRDGRLRLSRGRNHRTAARLARAAVVWAI